MNLAAFRVALAILICTRVRASQPQSYASTFYASGEATAASEKGLITGSGTCVGILLADVTLSGTTTVRIPSQTMSCTLSGITTVTGPPSGDVTILVTTTEVIASGTVVPVTSGQYSNATGKLILQDSATNTTLDFTPLGGSNYSNGAATFTFSQPTTVAVTTQVTGPAVGNVTVTGNGTISGTAQSAGTTLTTQVTLTGRPSPATVGVFGDVVLHYAKLNNVYVAAT